MEQFKIITSQLGYDNEAINNNSDIELFSEWNSYTVQQAINEDAAKVGAKTIKEGVHFI